MSAHLDEAKSASESTLDAIAGTNGDIILVEFEQSAETSTTDQLGDRHLKEMIHQFLRHVGGEFKCTITNQESS